MFLKETFSKNKEITENFLIAFISEPDIFNSNYCKIMEDIDSEFDFFIELIDDNLDLWNKYLIPNINNSVLTKLLKSKNNKVLELIINHELWLGESADCLLSKHTNCIEKFLQQSNTRKNI